MSSLSNSDFNLAESVFLRTFDVSTTAVFLSQILLHGDTNLI